MVNVLLWNWGQKGAAAKFTLELARHLYPKLPAMSFSSARGSELSDLFKQHGMETCEIATFRGDKTRISGQLSAAVGLFGLPCIYTKFRKLVRKNRRDVAFCTFGTIWDTAAIPLLESGNLRSIMVLHDAFLHPGEHSSFREAILRRRVQATDGLIVLSDHVRQQAISAYGYPEDRIWYMPHAAFSFSDVSAQPAKHPRGSRPLRLLFFGRIVAYKGLDHLLRAYRLLLDRKANVHLVIAGSGSLAPYKNLLRNLPVTIQNEWLSDDAIADLFKGTDVTVLPYVEASQSGVAASAYAAGRTVVATPIGGLIEQVQNGVTGFLARDMSVEALASAIRTLVDQPDLFDRCAERALAHALGPLSWRHSADVVYEAINAIHSRERRARR